MVKHAGATEVVIHLTPPAPSPREEGEKGVWLSIHDNGKGFDPDKPDFPGNGLVNMQKRMEEIGGRFEMESVPGKGTTVKLELP